MLSRPRLTKLLRSITSTSRARVMMVRAMVLRSRRRSRLIRLKILAFQSVNVFAYHEPSVAGKQNILTSLLLTTFPTYDELNGVSALEQLDTRSWLATLCLEGGFWDGVFFGVQKFNPTNRLVPCKPALPSFRVLLLPTD